MHRPVRHRLQPRKRTRRNLCRWRNCWPKKRPKNWPGAKYMQDWLCVLRGILMILYYVYSQCF